jgi:hypothetical protein
MIRALNRYGTSDSGWKAGDFAELLYENDFPDWFVIHADSHYRWNWKEALFDLRNTAFFFPSESILGDSIVGEYLSEGRARLLSEALMQKLAALATTLPTGEGVLRSLQLDGFGVNKERLTLVSIEGPMSPQQEETRLTALVKSSGIPNDHVILKHIEDAQSLYADGKDHPSLNESRNLLQVLIDNISVETGSHGKHTSKVPGGTSNRIDYLKNVNFFTAEEQSSFLSAWGTLSAGSHPGVPEREQARIGLILALEFGQLLIFKFSNWKNNAYMGFS